jgi:transcriptional regulator with XRE-family HTH domain
MTSSKKAFGQFVIAKRQSAGLTQRELAERLFVTESAVSKWERGVSYPDISLVIPLGRELGVTESELVNASDDYAAKQVEREARFYRRWKAAILWTTLLAYGVAVLTCFVVDLAVAHTLDWFWVVLLAVAVAFSLTTLPLLGPRHAGWVVVGMFLASLIALLGVIRLLYGKGSGAEWLPIAIASVLFAALVVFGPIVLWLTALPLPFAQHRTVIALAADTAGLAVLLAVILPTVGRTHELLTRAYPIAGLAAVFPWLGALVIRYVPLNGLLRAGIVVAFAGVYEYLVFTPLIRHIVPDSQPRSVDLSRWHDPYINGNVELLTLTGCLLAAAILGLAGALSRPRTP